MKKDNSMKVMRTFFIQFMWSFMISFLVILFFNTVVPLFFTGFSEFDFKEFQITATFYCAILIYSMFVAFGAKCGSVYFDLFTIFSVSRNRIMRTINITNVILTISGSAILNLLLLMHDIPDRGLFLIMITLSIYLILNFLNFIAFLGKLFGWYYIVGTFVLLAAFILFAINYIGGFIQMGLFMTEIILFFTVAAAGFFYINNFILSKRYEYKN
ncbi:MAG TPA: hypothetical protein PLI77_09790 [Bacteroidales bacterium]|nr:hypothetical protein [Bacteroidales bacterium]HRW34370.1 hypothetical protein [Thermotogota bacterium]